MHVHTVHKSWMDHKLINQPLSFLRWGHDQLCKVVLTPLVAWDSINYFGIAPKRYVYMYYHVTIIANTV